MLTRDAAVWTMHLARMTPTEIGAEIGAPRQTVERSILRSEKLHDPLQHLQDALQNEGTGEPDDLADPAPEWVVGTAARTAWLAARWDQWAAGLTVADIARIAATPNPALLLYRLRSHAPELHADVRRSINVAFKVLPGGPDDDDVAPPDSWQVRVAKARKMYTSDPAVDTF